MAIAEYFRPPEYHVQMRDLSSSLISYTGTIRLLYDHGLQDFVNLYNRNVKQSFLSYHNRLKPGRIVHASLTHYVMVSRIEQTLDEDSDARRTV
jgi:hypothetical protein